MFTIFPFSQLLKLFLGPTEDCYKNWNNLVMKTMVVGIRPRLARNIIFNIVGVSLLTVKCRFLRLRLRHFISVTRIHLWRISVFQRASENNLNLYFHEVSSASLRRFRPALNAAFSKWPPNELIAHPCLTMLLWTAKTKGCRNETPHVSLFAKYAWNLDTVQYSSVIGANVNVNADQKPLAINNKSQLNFHFSNFVSCFSFIMAILHGCCKMQVYIFCIKS